jgi:prepilin-type N-terminal cleavage/methylation domain-containing protein/prepilin-type processing-associated H-X9-DG protein
MSSHRHGFAGFTLVELLVVLFIVALLTALAMPAIQTTREASRRSSCLNNMRQLSLALHQFEASHGFLPPTLSLKPNEVMRHWQGAVIPYLEQLNVYQEMIEDFANRIHPWYQRHSHTTLPILQCLSNPDRGLMIPTMLGGVQFAFTDYCGVAGIAMQNPQLGVFPIGRLRQPSNGTAFREIRDGLSNTIAFGERPPVRTGAGYGRWLGSQHSASASIGVEEVLEAHLRIEPSDCEGCTSDDTGFQMGNREGTCDWLHHWSYHPAGANFSRADGSVSFLPYSTNSEVLRQLATRDGAESVSMGF